MQQNQQNVAKAILIALAITTMSGCFQSQDAEPAIRERIVGAPCEGCDAVFEGLPDEIPTAIRLAPVDEPGDAMRIDGMVRHQDGSVAAGTIVYAYQTDAEGIYPSDEAYRGQSAYRHGTLRGWVRTDEQGRYRITTVRPGSYPGTEIPAHIHLHVIEPGRCTYYIDDIVFTDDPLLTPDVIGDYSHGRGGIGITTPALDQDGVWRITRDISLGEGIHDYPPH